MKFRKLLGALTLVLFTMPLGSALCAACLFDQCPLKAADDAKESVGAAVLNHCGSAEEPAGEETASNASLDRLSTTCCCTLSAAPEPQVVVALAEVASFVPALQPTGETASHGVKTPRRSDQHSTPLLRVPKPLYTLHSAFLI